MKLKMKKLIVLLTTIMGLLFSACQNEPIEEPVTTIAYKNVLLQDLLATKTDSSPLEKANKINAINRYTGSNYGFFIDPSKGKYIQSVTTTYTFPIYRTTSNHKLENIVFKLNPWGNYSAYLVKYNITNKEFLLPTYNGHAKPIQCTLLTNVDKEAHTVKGWMDWDDFFHGQAPISGVPGDINPGGGDGSGGFIDILMCNNNGYGDYGDSHTAGDNCNNSHFLYTISVYTGNGYGSSYSGPGSLDTTPVGYEGTSGGVGLPNDQPVVISPDIVIKDIKIFLDCINKNQSASVSIYCLQPIANSSASHDRSFVGHTFISIIQGGQRKVIGFYPKSNWISPIYTTSPSVYGNDSNEDYNASISTNINSGQLTSIINYIVSNVNSQYNLETLNCTDFGIAIGNLAGLNLPDSYGTWPGGGGSNPGALGQHIRGLSGNNSSSGSINLKAPTSTICP
jgi:hypothetical protein